MTTVHDRIRHLLALGRLQRVPPEVQVEREMNSHLWDEKDGAFSRSVGRKSVTAPPKRVKKKP